MVEIIQAGNNSDIHQYWKWIMKSCYNHIMETYLQTESKRNTATSTIWICLTNTELKETRNAKCILYDSIYIKLKNGNFNAIFRDES